MTQSEAIYTILKDANDWVSLDDIISKMGVSRHVVRGRLSQLKSSGKIERKKTKKGIFFHVVTS